MPFVIVYTLGGANTNSKETSDADAMSKIFEKVLSTIKTKLILETECEWIRQYEFLTNIDNNLFFWFTRNV